MALQIARTASLDSSIIGLSRELKSYIDGSVNAFEMDMSGVQFLQVGQICLLAMVAKWAKAKYGKACITSLNMHQDVFRYLQRMDFFNYLNINVSENFVRHESDKFVEIRQILNDAQNTANDIPAKFREVIEASSMFDKSVISAIDKSFGEVMDNVLNHSRTEIPGIAVSQYYPKKGYAEFCVADAGIGIPESLRMNPAFREYADYDLLLRAFEFGVGENVYGSNNSDDGFGCGYGLTFAAKVAEASKGKLWAITNEHAICISGQGITRLDGCFFPGTIICMRIPSGVLLTEMDLNVDGKARPNRPYYWDAKGNELEDIYGNDILW